MKDTGVILVGCGTVGASVASLLAKEENASSLAQRSGIKLSLKHLVDVDFARAKSLRLDESIFTSDLDAALADESCSIVVELVGGTTIAKTIVEKALSAGKHVVTANKALLAHYGPELWALARENNVCIAFEASCVGGVPIITTLQEGLIANDIEALYGIVNGTCNYILSEMSGSGAAYADVLAQAQADGLAEADPTLDVSGEDSAHKIAIMAGLAFGQKIDYNKVTFEGIDSLSLSDLQCGWEFGYTIKLLAIAEKYENGISLRVHPAFIHDDHPLAKVDGAFNAVSVYGSANGHTLYYGRGAGGSATASAVVADIVSVAMGAAPLRFKALDIWPDKSEAANIIDPSELSSRYYIRINCRNDVGVLADVAAAFERNNISLSGVLQHESSPELSETDGVPIIITTYTALEGDVIKALAELDMMDAVIQSPVMIRIVHEHVEPEL